jgi:methane monooxygenase PmoA-like
MYSIRMKLHSWIFLLLALPLCAQVKITQGTGRISIEIDGKPYTDFFLAPDGNKPYVYPLRTASGIIVTRHFPMEKFPGETNDHPHHRGMFFSHGDINGINFWATEPSTRATNKGSMVLKKVLEAKGGKTSGTIKAVFDGLDPKGKPVMTETRTLVFYSDPKLRIIDYEILIDPLEKLKFVDTKEGTFGIRLATSMTEDKGGKMVNSEGAETEKNCWGKRAAWLDYDGQVDGQTVGVAVFDHPSNPRHPTYWHTRAYGLLAANIFGVHDFLNDKTKDGSLTVEPGQPLRFRYRVVIHPGDVRQAGIAALYEKYAATK